MRREAPENFELLGLPEPISGEQQPFEGQMHAGAAVSSFEVASFALCPCWLVFAGEEREGRKQANEQQRREALRKIPRRHGVQTSTEHLGHVGAEGDEKYVTG